MLRNINAFVFCILSVCTLIGCGGGSSDSFSQKLFEGTLTEAGGSQHGKHAVGQPIEDVTICALERCGLTDGEGRWGFVVPAFDEGSVRISVIGHGIDSSLEVNLRSDAQDYFFDLQHVEGGSVVAQGISIDGVVVDDVEHEHSAHDHSEQNSDYSEEE